MFLIILISIVIISVITIVIVSMEEKEEEEKEKLEKLENKEQTVEMYKKIINLNENDIIYLGKEYKVTKYYIKIQGRIQNSP